MHPSNQQSNQKPQSDDQQDWYQPLTTGYDFTSIAASTADANAMTWATPAPYLAHQGRYPNTTNVGVGGKFIHLNPLSMEYLQSGRASNSDIYLEPQVPTNEELLAGPDVTTNDLMRFREPIIRRTGYTSEPEWGQRNPYATTTLGPGIAGPSYGDQPLIGNRMGIPQMPIPLVNHRAWYPSLSTNPSLQPTSVFTSAFEQYVNSMPSRPLDGAMAAQQLLPGQQTGNDEQYADKAVDLASPPTVNAVANVALPEPEPGFNAIPDSEKTYAAWSGNMTRTIARQRLNLVNWTPDPEGGDDHPANIDYELEPFVRDLYQAITDLSRFRDKTRAQSANKVNRLVAQRYTQDEIEARCWDVVERTLDLHMNGSRISRAIDPVFEVNPDFCRPGESHRSSAPGKKRKRDPRTARSTANPESSLEAFHFKKKAIGDMNLSFRNRMRAICETVRESKAAATDLLDGQKVYAIIHTPNMSGMTKEENRKNNRNKQQKINAGRRAEIDSNNDRERPLGQQHAPDLHITQSGLLAETDMGKANAPLQSQPVQGGLNEKSEHSTAGYFGDMKYEEDEEDLDNPAGSKRQRKL
jgi:hypothetical protein